MMDGIIGDLSVTLGLDTKNFRKDMNAVERDSNQVFLGMGKSTDKMLGEVTKSLKPLGSSVGKVVSEIQGIDKSISNTNFENLNIGSTHLETMKKKAEETSGGFNALTNKYDKLKKASEDYSAAQDIAADGIVGLGEKFNLFGEVPAGVLVDSLGLVKDAADLTADGFLTTTEQSVLWGDAAKASLSGLAILLPELAGPFGLLGIAIVAGIARMKELSDEADIISEDAQNYCKGINEINESIETNSRLTTDGVQAMREQGRTANGLVKDIKTLAEESDKGADNQTKLREKVDALKAIYPGLGNVMNDTSRSMKDQAGELSNLVKINKEQANQDFWEERKLAVVQDLNEVEGKLYETEGKRAKYTAEVTKAQKDQTVITQQQGKATEEFYQCFEKVDDLNYRVKDGIEGLLDVQSYQTEGTDNVSEAVGNLKSKLKDCGDGVIHFNEVQSIHQGFLDECSDSYDRNGFTIKAAKDSLDLLDKKEKELNATNGELTEKRNTYNGKIEESKTKLTELGDTTTKYKDTVNTSSKEVIQQQANTAKATEEATQKSKLSYDSSAGHIGMVTSKMMRHDVAYNNALRENAAKTKTSVSDSYQKLGTGMNTNLKSGYSKMEADTKGVTGKIIGLLGSTKLANVLTQPVATWGKTTGDGLKSIKEKAESTLSGIVSYVNGIKFNPLEVTFAHIKLPHFSMSGSINAKTGEVPTVSVSWYDKGGLFDSPQIIGIAEKRPEFVGAAQDLRSFIKEAVGESLTVKANPALMQNLNRGSSMQAASGDGVVINMTNHFSPKEMTQAQMDYQSYRIRKDIGRRVRV